MCWLIPTQERKKKKLTPPKKYQPTNNLVHLYLLMAKQKGDILLSKNRFLYQVKKNPHKCREFERPQEGLSIKDMVKDTVNHVYILCALLNLPAHVSILSCPCVDHVFVFGNIKVLLTP